MSKSLRNWGVKALGWSRQHAALLAGLVGLFAADRISKYVILSAFINTLREPLWVVGPFLHIRYVENTGAAFGMMQGGNALLIVVMLVIIGYLLKSWRELQNQGTLAVWGGVCILAGALGNLYDRITLGYVVDFLDFLIWPVFNVADACITVGGGLLVLSLFVNRKKREEK